MLSLSYSPSFMERARPSNLSNRNQNNGTIPKAMPSLTFSQFCKCDSEIFEGGKKKKQRNSTTIKIQTQANNTWIL